MEGFIHLEVHEELIEAKFLHPIESRLMESSRNVYTRMTNEFHLEKGLLEYAYAVLLNGASSGDNFFNAKIKQKLSTILKTYSLADENSIPAIFDKSILNQIMAPMRGTPEDQEEIYRVFFHLLSQNQKIFLPNEIEMCKGEHFEIFSEYVCHSVVRTMCGHPPRNISLFDLSIRNSSIEFPNMDYLLLLGLAKKALLDFLKKSA